uniref:PDZ domain-containing protein n=1 Tax=Octactis speculum TaxID=3111310 RepID=A0A7S2GAT6_9STRA|mmetsp:Transcript_40973/g.55830  ORF Transcript_40973/g.55830 Transcript_40973/m.55830 type:complete len:1095 (+) Transcript_40973:41-3325(+)
MLRWRRISQIAVADLRGSHGRASVLSRTNKHPFTIAAVGCSSSNLSPLAAAANSFTDAGGRGGRADVVLAAALAICAAGLLPRDDNGDAAAQTEESTYTPPSSFADGDVERSWQRTIDESIPSIVSLKVNSTRAFDTTMPGASQATGFVIDAEKGLILTNRHVVCPGPIVAEAVFVNHEEVPVRAVYRDPVHDFGVLQYDPSRLRHLSAQAIKSLELDPKAPRVGMDIRVVGNNAGEKLTISAGVLARLDRAAPVYGRNCYNDFNTFYFQAASSTSGGSSGSPVLNKEGKVVALNAAGKVGTAASFYLPLDRVKRAVNLIREGKPVLRGSLQTTFVHRPFNELTRLGLDPETEAGVRERLEEEVGMLVVQSLVPMGPADQLLQPGDILLRLGGKLITRFCDLEEILDDSAGSRVTLSVLRGGEKKQFVCEVQDLHSITPSEYLEMGDSVFNNLSYHQARNHILPVPSSVSSNHSETTTNHHAPDRGQQPGMLTGVYVAHAGHMLRSAGIATGSLIQSIGDVETLNVQALEAALSALPDGCRVPVRCAHVSHKSQSAVTVLRIDRRWYPMNLVKRSDETGSWVVTPSPTPPSPAPEANLRADAPPVKTRLPPGSNAAEKALSSSLCQVYFSMPYMIDGTAGSEFKGTGVVVDTEKGLVVVDRNTVPGSLGDVQLAFGASLRVPARVCFIHPLHNLAFLSYDPKSIGSTPVTAAQLCQETDIAPKHKAEKVTLVGLSGSLRSGAQLTSTVATVSENNSHAASLTYPPRFTDCNLDTLGLAGVSPTATQDGVVVDKSHETVLALWSSFPMQVNSNGRLQELQIFQGIPADIILEVLEPLRKGETPLLNTIGAEFEYIGLAQVRGIGLDDATIELLEARAVRWPPQLLSVRRRWADFPAMTSLEDGDVLLTVDAKPVQTFREAELAVSGKDSVMVEVLRGGQRVTTLINTVGLGTDETSEILLWAGAVLQKPPQAAGRQRAVSREGVYVASLTRGSPANWYGLQPTCRIIEVDGLPTPNLTDLLTAVRSKKDGESMRIKQEDLRGNVQVTTLKLDLKYWPTYRVLKAASQSSDKEGMVVTGTTTDNRYTWTRELIPSP